MPSASLWTAYWAKGSSAKPQRTGRTRVNLSVSRMPSDRIGSLQCESVPRRVIRPSHIARQAPRDEVIERPERLLPRGDEVGAVKLVEVDPVGTESAQGSFRIANDVAMAYGAPSGSRGSAL
jgi:hypothetical protein